MKKAKKKAKTRLWERIFVASSIAIIVVIIGVYAYRTIHYYKIMNYIAPDAKLVDVITNQNNIVYTGDGLYKENDDKYYYSGKEANNYINYNGLLWHIIGVDETGIKMITEENITSLVWSNDTNYENSNIYKWLTNSFIKNLDSNSLLNSNWCNKFIDLNDYKCEETIESNIGLITTEEYLKSGGINSYLNNSTYFWTLNTSEDNKAYYVHTAGGINNDIGNTTALYSYGVRPVIYLDKNTLYHGGNGTKESPYITDNNKEVMINDHPIGTYILYNNYTWRIIENGDGYTKLILDGYLKDDNKEPIKMSYSKVDTYLRNTFLKEFNTEDMVESNYLKTEVNLVSLYNYANSLNDTKGYINIPVVGDLFINDYETCWLNTYYNQKQGLIYTTGKEGSLLADLSGDENYVRPIISLKGDLMISSGSGTQTSPLVVGDNE